MGYEGNRCAPTTFVPVSPTQNRREPHGKGYRKGKETDTRCARGEGCVAIALLTAGLVFLFRIGTVKLVTAGAVIGALVSLAGWTWLRRVSHGVVGPSLG